jgi:quinoprotein glucose dehydrogenase
MVGTRATAAMTRVGSRIIVFSLMWRGLRRRSGAALIVLAAAGVAAGAQSRSVWQGVYTAEQAERGRKLYIRDCAECHGPALTGGEAGSALIGRDFVARWEKKSLSELFELMRKTMPDAAPGSLSSRQYLDLVAYLLKENEFPAGGDELAGGEALGAISFAKP